MTPPHLPLAARRGRHAERLARQHVQNLGMRLVAANLRVGYLELDIVARDGAQMVIVEVRARGGGAWQGALASIGHRKRERLKRAGAILWARRWHRDRRLRGVRFDIIAVDLGHDPPQLEHLRAAFS